MDKKTSRIKFINKVATTNLSLPLFLLVKNNNLYFIFDKREYSDLFKYLTISLSVCSFFIPHMSNYYKDESHESDPKLQTIGFFIFNFFKRKLRVYS